MDFLSHRDRAYPSYNSGEFPQSRVSYRGGSPASLPGLFLDGDGFNDRCSLFILKPTCLLVQEGAEAVGRGRGVLSLVPFCWTAPRLKAGQGFFS